jgi:hypothetical protein
MEEKAFRNSVTGKDQPAVKKEKTLLLQAGGRTEETLNWKERAV